ncbi:putative membrane protein [Cryptosporidium felis]|nr:putative membrane protein [Cryptosporidium felis]
MKIAKYLYCYRRIYFIFTFIILRLIITEAYSIEGLSVPPPKSILIYPYQFSVFEKNEFPIKLFTFMTNAEFPTVHFNELSWVSNNFTEKNYENIEVLIIPSNDLDDLMRSGQLGECCNKENLLSGYCKIENTLIKPNKDSIISLKLSSYKSSSSFVIKKGGIYSLMISNCGNSNEGHLSGQVIIKNVYGFLPGVEFMKIGLYFIGTIFYFLLSIFWIYKCIINNSQLINMQLHMCIVLLLSTLSSLIWLHFFRVWNLTGVQSKYLYGISTVINALKLTLVAILTLIASHGVGVSIVSLKSSRQLTVSSLGLVYFFSTLFKEYVAYLSSSSREISFSLLLSSILPVGLINGTIFFWVFHELVILINGLEDDKQTEKLLIYKRFMLTLFASILLAAIFFIFEIRIFSWNMEKRWKYQWVIQDAVPLFFVSTLLLNLILLWIPKENSKKYLIATEVPMGIVIELETQELSDIDYNNEKIVCFEKNCTKQKTSSLNNEILSITSVNNCIQSEMPERVYLQNQFEILEQNNSREKLPEYLEECINENSKNYENENLMNIINIENSKSARKKE